MMYEMISIVISELTFVWVLSVRSWKSVAFIKTSLEELPVCRIGSELSSNEDQCTQAQSFGWFRHTDEVLEFLFAWHALLPVLNL